MDSEVKFSEYSFLLSYKWIFKNRVFLSHKWQPQEISLHFLNDLLEDVRFGKSYIT